MSKFDLAGRKALVTGGARGLGAGMAAALSKAGAAVMIGDGPGSGRVIMRPGAAGSREGERRDSTGCGSIDFGREPRTLEPGRL